MNGILTTLVTTALVASGASGVFLVGPDLGVSQTPALVPEIPSTPLPPLPPVPPTGDPTEPVDPVENETADSNETAEPEPASAENETSSPQEEASEEHQDNATMEECPDGGYSDCGTAIYEDSLMVGPTQQVWTWNTPTGATTIYFSAQGVANTNPLGMCDGDGSSVRLFDGKGKLVAKAEDTDALGLGGWLDLSHENGGAPGEWRLEFDGCYATGQYWVQILADCRTD